MKTKNKGHGKRGQTLVMVLVIIAVGVMILTPMFEMGKQAGSMTSRWRSYDQCFLTAATVMEKAKWDIQNSFLSYYNANPLPMTLLKFSWFDTFTSTQIGATGAYSAPQGQTFSNALVWVTILGVQISPAGGRNVILDVKCQYNGVTREIEEVVQYQRVTSGVFNYSYFINNFGWFWGDTIYANGDIRANGNFSFGGYNPTVNGNVTAGIDPDNGATGIIDGNSPIHYQVTNGQYYANSPSRARPGSPTSNSITSFSGSSWDMGYNGNPIETPYQTNLAMPYLGNLSDYEWLATNKNGVIWQGSPTNILVNGVYSGPGPSGKTNGADLGCLILDGSGAKPPLHISGPVVITGDVIIKGSFTGQGTIYAGRNVYIAGDIIATNPPVWPKPDPNPDATVAANDSRDMLALCAKGCTLMGNYTDSTWQYYVDMYAQPGFTEAYQIDPSDLGIGYGSYQDGSGNWWFNGNYTAKDGGLSVSGTGTTARTFITSSIDATKYQSIVQSSCIHEIDAVTYNNHLLTGLVGDGPGITFNGSIVSRDEAIIYYTQVNMNWDIRLGSTSKDATAINIYLPGTMSAPQTVHFKEF